MIARITTGTAVQISSSRVCPCTCAPSTVRGAAAAPVLPDEDDEHRLDENEDRGREAEDEVVDVLDVVSRSAMPA